jgi:HEAT repeat protein
MLAADNTAATIDELTDSLDDKNWAVRVAAARALAKLHHRDMIPKLKNMMENDKEQLARFSAAAAIIHLGESSGKARSPASAKAAGSGQPGHP